MSSILTCDHCHRPIDETGSRIRVSIERRGSTKAIRDTLKDRARAAEINAKALLGVHLDLHQECYITVFASTVSKVGS